MRIKNILIACAVSIGILVVIYVFLGLEGVALFLLLLITAPEMLGRAIYNHFWEFLAVLLLFAGIVGGVLVTVGILKPDVWVLKQRAVELEKKGKLEEAKQLYWKTISMDIPSIFPYERLRIIYSKQGDLKGAIKACEAYVNTLGYDDKKERMKEWIQKYQAKLDTSS